MDITKRCEEMIKTINDDFEGIVSKEQFEYYLDLDYLDEYAVRDLQIMFYGTICNCDLPNEEKQSLKAFLSRCHTVDDFKALFDSLSTQIQTEQQIGKAMGEKICELKHETPPKKTIIERVIKDNADDELKNEYMTGRSSIGVVILKQFVKHLKVELKLLDGLNHHWSKSAGIKGISQHHITPEAFLPVSESPKKYRINKNDYDKNSYVYAFIEAARGFENEYINETGLTRLYMYFLAFAFDLRYFPDKDVISYNQKTDFEHLFLDYFADSLNEQPDNTNRWYSGKAINYKNYVEIVFLYFLDYRKDEDRNTRFKNALKVLATIKEAESDTYSPLDTTGYYKKSVIELLNSDKNSLISFILKHCKTNNDLNESRILIASQTNTAASVYNELTAANQSFFSEYFHSIADSFLNFPSFGSDLKDTEPNILLDAVMYRMGVHKATGEISFDNCNSDTITRTHLLQALSFTFLRETFDSSRDDRCISLPILYSAFSERVNQTLENCGYAPINAKFILDYIVILILHYVINNEHRFYEE